MELNFKKSPDGLLPAIVQDAKTLAILMQGFMNQAAFDATLKTGLVHFYSRSQGKLWKKGETSGDFLKLIEIYTDCDQDSILVKAMQMGKATCHTGRASCFHYRWNPNTQDWELEA